MTHKYDKDIKQRAVLLYSEGHCAAEISKIIGANEATIRNWLKAADIQIRSGGMYSAKYDIDTINKLIEMYNNGFNTPQIGKILHLKRGIASYLLRKNNIQLKHRGPKSMIGNEDFFDKIDTEQKAYFLGWIMADGSVSVTNGQYSLKLHIALKDKELIDIFLASIGSVNKTKARDGKYPSYYVSLTSVHMCKSLINLGVVPRKSGFEIFPDEIPLELKHHFIRGVFDGDGIVSDASNRSGFVGSKNMMVNILNELGEEQITIFNNKRSENIFYFLGGKKFSNKLYNYLYQNATIWLSRKKESLEKICFK